MGTVADVAIELRWAAANDLAELQQLYRASSAVWPSDRDFLHEHPELLEPTAQQVDEGQVRLLREGGQLAGFTTVVIGERGAELEALFVSPEASGRGLGRCLVEDAVRQVMGVGLTSLEVVANPNAAGFYERVGFVACGAVETRFGPAVRMVCEPLPTPAGMPRSPNGSDPMVVEESIDRLGDHAAVSIAFRVEWLLDVNELAREPAGLAAAERPVASPWVKDYDAIDGEGPSRWARLFDVSKWGLLVAYRAGQRVGGAVVAFDTPGVNLLEGLDDLAVLWDLRIQPESRSQGVGAALVEAVESWARARVCTRLKVETQNVNVAACRFYARLGFRLVSIERDAYPDLPEEVQLIWSKPL